MMDDVIGTQKKVNQQIRRWVKKLSGKMIVYITWRDEKMFSSKRVVIDGDRIGGR